MDLSELEGTVATGGNRRVSLRHSYPRFRQLKAETRVESRYR